MKILIVEADHNLPEDWDITEWAADMEKAGHEVQYVYRIETQDGADAAKKLLPWAETLAFGTTFAHYDSVFSLFTELGNALHFTTKQLNILIDAVDINRVFKDFMHSASLVRKWDYDREEEYWESEEDAMEKWVWQLRNIKFFKLERDDHHENWEPKRVMTFQSVIDRLQKAIDDKKAYMDERRSFPTGRMVRVGRINTGGPEFDVLKEDDVVPELEMKKEYFGQYHHGVWVWGLTEPVKLVTGEYQIVRK